MRVPIMICKQRIDAFPCNLNEPLRPNNQNKYDTPTKTIATIDSYVDR